MAETPSNERRRLSLAFCDPVPAERRRSEGGGGTEERYGSIRRAKLFDLLKEEIGERRAISVTSVTDRDLGRRKEFSEKDSEVLVPDGKRQAEMEQWLATLGYGFCSKKGLKPEAPNQDSYSLLVVEGLFAVYGIYDGHGPQGHYVSDVVRDILPKLFLVHEKRATEPEVALKESFLNCQNCIEFDEKNFDPASSGTTCTLAFHNFLSNTVSIAHVGDSRGVLLSRQPSCPGLAHKDLTIDHKPNLEKERKRIESSNPPGRVIFDGFCNHRVFAQGCSYPGLNMSRALGDIIAHKSAGLSAEPDIYTFSTRAGGADAEQFLLICTDGVWEFIESNQASGFIGTGGAGGIDLQADMGRLAQASYQRWMQDSDNEIADDITGICVPL